MKSTSFFGDKNQKANQSAVPDFLQSDTKETSEPTVTLTKEEYKEVIKEAYKEGVEKALNNTEKSTSTMNPSEVKEATHQGEKEGEKEAVKVQTKDTEINKQKLENIMDRHDIELLRAKSLFPFQLFPDTITIDTTKVTIIEKTMFATEAIHSCTLKDLSDVEVQTAFFMGTVYIRYMPQSNSPGMNEPKEIKITALKREDAMKAKKILRGVLVAKAEKINIATLTPEELQAVLEKFGNSEALPE